MNRLQALRRDDGTTLTELLVGMSLMAVFMTIFTAVIFSMNTATAHTENTALTAARVNVAFAQLDKTVRYASAISTESSTANAAGNYYIEYQTTNTGPIICTQLQLATATDKLNVRTWRVSPITGQSSQLTGFTVLAANVDVGDGLPFKLIGSGVVSVEQLRVSLAASQSSGTARSVTSQATVTFPAVNSRDAATAARTDSTAPASICNQQGRP